METKCTLCVSSLYPCSRQRDDDKKTTLTNKVLFWFLIAIVILAIIWLYCWSIIGNDFNDANDFIFEVLKSWFHWYIFLLILTIVIVTYVIIVLTSGLVRIFFKWYLYLHFSHVFFIFFFLALVIAAFVLVETFWSYQWASIGVSFQITGPFLQLSALFLWVLFSWYCGAVMCNLERSSFKILTILSYSIVLVFLCSIPLWLYSPCIGTNMAKNLKPLLLAHRGASSIRPENTISAFNKSAEFSVFCFESDVRISSDGVPFLMHDTSLLRTTNVAKVFPERKNNNPATFTWEELQQLNAGNWFLHRNPFLTNHHLTVEEKQIIQKQKIPSLLQFANFAESLNTSIMFDLFRPPEGHPYFENWINVTVETILNSTIKQNKVLWIYNDHQDVVNKLAPFFKLVSANAFSNATAYDINYFNLLHSDVTEDIINFGIPVIAYVVNANWAFSRSWCQGVHAVTTDYSQVFSYTDKVLWNMSKAQFLGIWITVDFVGICAVVAVFIYFKFHINKRVPLMDNDETEIGGIFNQGLKSNLELNEVKPTQY